jgi:hypothetical protein
MKKLIITLFILALCIGGVSALSLTFQNPGDFSAQITTSVSAGGSAAGWIQSTTGGNSYVYTNVIGFGTQSYIMGATPTATTYAAVTKLSESSSYYAYDHFLLMDGSHGVLQDMQISYGAGRYELKIVGGTPKVYLNGVLKATGSVLAQNPQYVAFGTTHIDAWGGYTAGATWDDYVYGDSENKYIVDSPQMLPQGQTYIIYKDFVNPASGGFAKADGTVINSQYMPYSWGRGNNGIPPDALANENINLVNFGTNVVYNTSTTGTAYYGSGQFDIKEALLDSGAPQGYYAVIIQGSGKYSDVIQYMNNGATVAWGSKTYSNGDVGSITYTVASGGYWNTSGYTYKVVVYDAYLNFYGNTTITTQTGNVSHTWESTNNPGVYFAGIIATSRTTGADSFMGGDYTTLSSYVNFAGWVNNAETQAVIYGASVNISQGATIVNTTSFTDGNYTAGGFLTGGTVSVNITKSGYRQYTYSFTPLIAHTVSLNFTLVPNTPAYSGLALGGVDRDIVYGRPISGATVAVQNTTTGEYYTKTTNNVGYYLCDAGSACILASPQVYNVWGSKLHYSNSTIYTPLVV